MEAEAEVEEVHLHLQALLRMEVEAPLRSLRAHPLSATPPLRVLVCLGAFLVDRLRIVIEAGVAIRGLSLQWCLRVLHPRPRFIEPFTPKSIPRLATQRTLHHSGGFRSLCLQTQKKAWLCLLSWEVESTL